MWVEKPSFRLKESRVSLELGAYLMADFILTAPNANRYTYFVAFYGKDLQHQTAVLYVQHCFDITVQALHIQIRERINQVLGPETPSCYHILAMATPEAVPV